MVTKSMSVLLYDAEKYHNTKRGAVTKHIKIEDKTAKELDEIAARLRAEQKAKNREFKKTKLKQQSGQLAATLDIPPPVATQPEQLKIEFDKSTGNTFVLFGASKSGKTTLMMKLYNEYFPEFTPHKMLLSTLFAMNSQLPIYDHKYLLKCSHMNENTSNYIDWQRKTNKINNNKFMFLNMFDDFIDVRYTAIVNNLILTYRNSNMNAIICLQYVNLLSKAARSNVNNVFLLHMNTDESIEVCIKVYLTGLLKKLNVVDPIQWYRSMTDNHNYIYIHTLSGKVYISKEKRYENM